MRARHPQLIVHLLLIVLSCTLLAGCQARQSDDQYADRLEQAVAARSEAIAALDGKKLVKRADYDAAAAQLDSAIGELDADPPPRSVQDAHERMLGAMEGLSTLLGRLGRCDELGTRSQQDGRACRASIDQDVYDGIRNDFGEADTIYRAEGFSPPGLGGGEDGGGGASGGDTLDGDVSSGGDEL